MGHSDTVPALVRELSGVAVPPIPLGEFDNLFCVLGDRVLRLRYGAPG